MVASSANRPDWLSRWLLVGAAGALLFGVWRLASAPELPALYWLVAAALSLKAGSDRERALASR
ncbi:MAG TPA: hypothetical protein VFS67_17275 [Polyangiaceae bacterium]|jgi:hypothetical protein|nr:hypothetical protein [Polyangiaceae bacterium]